MTWYTKSEFTSFLTAGDPRGFRFPFALWRRPWGYGVGGVTTEGRFRLASRMAVLGIGANVLLAVVKGIVGVWAGSRA